MTELCRVRAFSAEGERPAEAERPLAGTFRFCPSVGDPCPSRGRLFPEAPSEKKSEACGRAVLTRGGALGGPIDIFCAWDCGGAVVAVARRAGDVSRLVCLASWALGLGFWSCLGGLGGGASMSRL